MVSKELTPILQELQDKFYNNVLVIKYGDDEYIVSRRWEVKPNKGVLNILVEKNFTEPTPYHVGEVLVLLNELPGDLEIKFYSKFSARHFNSSRIGDLEFLVKRQ